MKQILKQAVNQKEFNLDISIFECIYWKYFMDKANLIDPCKVKTTIKSGINKGHYTFTLF